MGKTDKTVPTESDEAGVEGGGGEDVKNSSDLLGEKGAHGGVEEAFADPDSTSKMEERIKKQLDELKTERKRRSDAYQKSNQSKVARRITSVKEMEKQPSISDDASDIIHPALFSTLSSGMSVSEHELKRDLSTQVRKM